MKSHGPPVNAMASTPDDVGIEKVAEEELDEKAGGSSEAGTDAVLVGPEVSVDDAKDQPADETEELLGQGIQPQLKATTLLDRALYRGHVNGDSQPHGLGLVYPALGTHIYGGEFHDGHKAGLGVQLLPNGTLYAGEFEDEYPSGYGVKRDPFGSQFVGQWSEGELHGVGLSVGVDGEVSWGRFHLNELDDAASDSETSWPQTQQAVLRAVLAEQNAIQAQERARQVELQVMLQGLTTIHASYFKTQDEISEFTAQEEEELKSFLAITQREYKEVEAEADRWKLQEAQLKERQKNLRREITEKRTELSFLAKYVGIADERQAQVVDAERTLQALHRQIELLQTHVLETPDEVESERHGHDEDGGDPQAAADEAGRSEHKVEAET